jgi:hypothetical protein
MTGRRQIATMFERKKKYLLSEKCFSASEFYQSYLKVEFAKWVPRNLSGDSEGSKARGNSCSTYKLIITH